LTVADTSGRILEGVSEDAAAHPLEKEGRMRISRLLALLTGAAALIAVAAPSALGDKPIRFELGPPPPTLPADICGFPITVETLSINQTGMIFSNGVFAATGTLKVRLTNATDPTNSVDLNISGPGRLIPQADGATLLMAEGLSLFFFLPGQMNPGSPGALLITDGLVTELIDANGNVVPGSFNPRGHVEDVCALLS
jgi:hypothetical protein